MKALLDFLRPKDAITLASLTARTISANGTATPVPGQYRRWVIQLAVSNADTDAGDTLDVYVDVSIDGGTTWLNAVHFNQIIGTDSASKAFAVLDPSNPGTSTVDVTSDAAEETVRPALIGPLMRARWAITDAGTDDASFTFAVTAWGQP